MSITKSRYDFMKDGVTMDEITGSYYPDPLSLNFSDFKMDSLPIKNVMNPTKIVFLWKEADDFYGQPCWDDMVLTLNGIPHKNFLEVGDELYFPTEDDLLNSFNKER